MKRRNLPHYLSLYILYWVLIAVNVPVSGYVQYLRFRTYEILPGLVYEVAAVSIFLFILLGRTRLNTAQREGRGPLLVKLLYFLASLSGLVFLYIYPVQGTHTPGLLLCAATLFDLAAACLSRKKH